MSACTIHFTSGVTSEQRAPLSGNSVYELGHLKVKVDLTPIGGYRGKVGTLAISHEEHKVFTDWSTEDLAHLAELERKILYIQEQAKVINTLIFATQDQEKESFKLSLIPYPSCSWIEKVQGLFHVIFGPPTINESQAAEIAHFYRSKFNHHHLDIPGCAGTHREGKPDAFCRESVLSDQRIGKVIFGVNHPYDKYDILYDKYPKGASLEDPHFLIIPEGDSGHCDGSQLSVKKRTQMLGIAQEMMQIFLTENKFSTLILLERNGEQLQGVQHKHLHVMGIENFPTTFLEKIKVLIRQIFAQTPPDFKDRMEHYRSVIPVPLPISEEKDSPIFEAKIT